MRRQSETNLKELPITMCVARNPYRQPNTLLLQLDESPLDAATTSQDNTIFTSTFETPSKHEEECVKTPSQLLNIIMQLILICIISMIMVSLQQTSRAQQGEAKALQLSMIRIRALHDSQIRILADLDMQTQKMNIDFRPL